MLVLARKLSEAIRVGDEVRITIVEIRAGRVRLGIEAPRHIRIRRDELILAPDHMLTEVEIESAPEIEDAPTAYATRQLVAARPAD